MYTNKDGKHDTCLSSALWHYHCGRAITRTLTDPLRQFKMTELIWTKHSEYV